MTYNNKTYIIKSLDTGKIIKLKKHSYDSIRAWIRVNILNSNELAFSQVEPYHDPNIIEVTEIGTHKILNKLIIIMIPTKYDNWVSTE